MSEELSKWCKVAKQRNKGKMKEPTIKMNESGVEIHNKYKILQTEANEEENIEQVDEEKTVDEQILKPPTPNCSPLRNKRKKKGSLKVTWTGQCSGCGDED
eukprot:5005916-Karenia_brevis.AAC.1